jgi:type I restriction enzyme M protein
MKSVKTVSSQIQEVEGFDVEFVPRDVSDVSSRRVEDYPYQRAARGSWSVTRWKQDRFESNYPDFEVQVLSPDGEAVHGRTLLDNLRAQYLDAGDDFEVESEAEDETPSEPPRATRESQGTQRQPTGQQDIESWLWEAANILRGPVDPANLRDFVFPLLFLKRLSDTWDEEQARAVELFGPDVDDSVADDFHAFRIPKGCHWSDLRRVAENHGIKIQTMMQQIEAANPERLAQIFGNAPWADHNKMPPERLHRLVEHFGKRDLRPSLVSNDLLGGGYEYLLKRFSDESATSAGQFFTPRAVVHLLVRILDPKPTDSIYDPACGSAGMLIEAANEVKQSGGSVAQMRFYGQEVNQTSAAIGRMNLLIHEVEDAQIRREDTLGKPLFVDNMGRLEQFDIVVANPPFSLKDWGADKWATDPHKRAIGGVPPKGNGDYAWVQHMVASMKKDTGRVGVVMPHGVLFRGSSEAKIRQYLIENDLLDAVIGLAPNLFYGTTIPASLLIFKVAKDEKHKNHVLFIDGSKRFTKGRNQNELSEPDVQDLYEMYASSGEGERTDISARLVSRDEIEGNSWDLNIGRYLKTTSAEVVDVASALESLTEARVKLAAAEQAMLERLKGAGYA